MGYKRRSDITEVRVYWTPWNFTNSKIKDLGKENVHANQQCDPLCVLVKIRSIVGIENHMESVGFLLTLCLMKQNGLRGINSSEVQPILVRCNCTMPLHPGRYQLQHNLIHILSL